MFACKASTQTKTTIHVDGPTQTAKIIVPYDGSRAGYDIDSRYNVPRMYEAVIAASSQLTGWTENCRRHSFEGDRQVPLRAKPTTVVEHLKCTIL